MDIVEELRKDRENGAKRLEAEYKTGLMALACRFCNDSGDAEELVNATLAEVVENVDDFLEQSSLFTWMCKILISKFSRANRRKSNRMEVLHGEIPEVADEQAQEAIYNNLDASLLRDAIETLPPDIRNTLVMHYFMDIPVAEIARVLSVRSGTVKWRLHNARLALAAKLGVAAKTPGGRALLLALALFGLTALGAAVWNLAVSGEAQNTGNAVEAAMSNMVGPRSVATVAEAGPPRNAAPEAAEPSTFQPSTFQPSTFNENSPGDNMNTRTLLTAALGAALASGAASPASAGVLDAGSGVYVITVPAGETNALSAADVSAASGYAIAKRGGGALAADATAAAFSGEIRIEEGVWLVSGKGGLGTGAGGASVSDGAALHLSDGTADNIRLATGAVALTLCGSGPDGLGAMRNSGSAKQTKIFNNGGSIALAGDATIGGANLGLSGNSSPAVNLGGHALAVAMNADAPFVLSAASVSGLGGIEVQSGRLMLNGPTTWAGGAEGAVTVRNGAAIGFLGTANPVPWSLALESGSSIYPQSGDVEADASLNVWSGPVTVASGRVDVYYSDSSSTGVHMSGPVGGDGGFRLAGATALRLSCPTNSFANGVVLNGASTTAGGLILDATGALPAESSISNVIGGEKGFRQRVVAAEPGITLPDMTFSREGSLGSAAVGTPAAIGTLGKVNNNAFAISGGIAVTNLLSVSGNGTVSFAADTAEYAGLYMAATNFSTTKATACDEYKDYFGLSDSPSTPAKARAVFTEPVLKGMAEKLLSELPLEKVEHPDLAYRAWNPEEAQRCAAYRGYFLNPESTNVVATFAISIADIAAVWLDGECVVMNVDSKSLSGGTSSTYFLTIGEGRLSPGAHELMILIAHNRTSSYGPKSLVAGDVKAGMDWQVANFGLGWRLGAIDPSATTNAADYAAVSNTTGRLLLVRETGDALSAARPSVKAITVAVADNALSFGADSVALPYEIAELSGTTEISSGALRVTESWTVAAGDLKDGRSLVVADGASLDLTGTTLLSPDWRALGRIAHEGVAIASADDAASLVGLPALPASLENGWSIKRELDGAGGVEIKLFYSASFIMIIR